MSVICDICKTRPATARITFVRDGKPRVLDICQEDYVRMQSTSPYGELLGHELYPNQDDAPIEETVEIVQAFSELSHRTMQRAAEIAMEYGQAEMGTEHVLLSLVEINVIQQLLKSFKIQVLDIQGYIGANAERGDHDSNQIGISEAIKKNAHAAWHISKELKHEYLGPEHLFIALIQDDEGMAGELLRKYGLTAEMVRQKVVTLVGDGAKDGQLKTVSKTPQLDKYSRDLSALAKDHMLDPVIGRSDEIDSTIEVLSRRTKNNPVLIGEPGVGKTAIIEGLAQRIVGGTVPSTLKDKRVVEVNINSLVAGTRYRGEFEDRIKGLLEEITKHKDELIVFVDELHTVVGAGGSEGGLDTANALKPSLARGDLHLIGATTLNEYQKYIEKDTALERRFQPIVVPEPTATEAVAIIHGLKERYESYHGIEIKDEAILSAVELSSRYMTSRFLPDKAIDLIDQAAARAKIKAEKSKTKKSYVGSKEIAELVSKLTGVPVTELTEKEKAKLLKLEERLRERVIGQENAVTAVANAIRMSRAGLSEGKRPVATFLFLGPTGVGKTELAKSLAEELFGNEDLITRIDMSEYMERHSVSRLIGSPPGYVGYDEGGQLTEAVRRHPYSVILLDEIEKAHPEVANVLLQLLDDGRLTDGKGRVVNFTNAIIIATSNVGSEFYNKPSAIGFKSGSASEEEELKDVLMEKLGAQFRPEFINRIDDIIIFHALNEAEIKKIVRLQLGRIAAVMTAQNVELSFSPALIAHFAEVGYKPEFGARELRRKIKQELENALASQLLQGGIKPGDAVTATYGKDAGVSFKLKATK